MGKTQGRPYTQQDLDAIHAKGHATIETAINGLKATCPVLAFPAIRDRVHKIVSDSLYPDYPQDLVLEDVERLAKELAPKFAHDCDRCQFIGHFIGHDVYTCTSDKSCGSVIARYGNEGHEYASTDLVSIYSQFVDPSRTISIEKKHVPYQEFLLSEKCADYAQAIMLAMAALGARSLPSSVWG